LYLTCQTLQLQSAIAHLERLILKSKVKRVDGTSSPPGASAENVSPTEQSFFKAAKTVRSNSASSLEHSTDAAAAVAAATKFVRLNDIDGATTATRRSSASSTAASAAMLRCTAAAAALMLLLQLLLALAVALVQQQPQQQQPQQQQQCRHTLTAH
jgi:preprotein translocase subunit SecG